MTQDELKELKELREHLYTCLCAGTLSEPETNDMINMIMSLTQQIRSASVRNTGV